MANELTKVTESQMLQAFGGADAPLPIEVAWPEIKMGKDDKFAMPDGTDVKQLTGHIIYARKTRAWFEQEYGKGDTTFPDCASSDAVKPDLGDQMQSEFCATCPKSKWVKNEEDENKMDCRISTIVMFLPDGCEIPYLLRVRSTSCHKKSSLAKFFSNCRAVKDFALMGKYPTVEVELSLEKTKINNFDSSYLIVEAIGPIGLDSPLLPKLMSMYNTINDELVVTHVVEETVDEDNPI